MGRCSTQGHKANRDLLTKMSSIRNTDGGLVVQRSYTYDKLGRPLTRQTLRSGGAMNETFDYDDRSENTRRLAGRLDTSAAFAPKGENCRRLEGRLAKSDRFCPSGVRSREATPQASIDGARPSQLTGATLGEAPYAYSYDNIGNRITAQEDAESVTYEANNLNQYTQIDTDGTAFVPEYDADGNQTRIQTVTGIWKVQYNGQNRAIRYESEADSTHIITCVYDSQGRRVEKKEEKEGAVISHVRYVYRGYLQVAAYDLLAEGLPSLWQIIWDPTQDIATRPLAIRADGAYSTYGWDLTKNICETYAGATGFLGHRYAYSPYGLVSLEGDTSYQPIQWSSEVYDEELGLNYYNYRYYNPGDGRWTRRDLFDIAGGLNMYCFITDSPLLNTDHLGKVVISAPDVGLQTELSDGTVQDSLNSAKEEQRRKKLCCVKEFAWVLHGDAEHDAMLVGRGNRKKKEYNHSRDPNQATIIDLHNAQSIATALRNTIKFCSPCTIYLLSCNMGVREGGIPQIFANQTGCEVFAPRGYCYPNVREPEKSRIEANYTAPDGEVQTTYPGSKDGAFRRYIPQ